MSSVEWVNEVKEYQRLTGCMVNIKSPAIWWFSSPYYPRGQPIMVPRILPTRLHCVTSIHNEVYRYVSITRSMYLYYIYCGGYCLSSWGNGGRKFLVKNRNWVVSFPSSSDNFSSWPTNKLALVRLALKRSHVNEVRNERSHRVTEHETNSS